MATARRAKKETPDSEARALRPPSLRRFLGEGLSVAIIPRLLLALPRLSRFPRGHGEPVLLLPGFGAGDASNAALNAMLRYLGYRVYGWGLGLNRGNVEALLPKVEDRVRAIRDQAGLPVRLVGWSLGGVFARDLALSMPAAVRSVITLGSPFAGDISATNARKLYEEVTGEKPTDARPQDLRALGGDLGLPTSSIYSRYDGVVHWRTSLTRENDHTENIEIAFASHLGLGGHPAALWAIADRLAQKEGEFAPFRRGGPFALAYFQREPK